ncbi:MAG: ornithine cyclodeaminase family protein [Thermoplasmata archaeon]|jgi:ornithine cyclodeaminase/alanine dehydrogenase-like protein (mu-crystallin family)
MIYLEDPDVSSILDLDDVIYPMEDMFKKLKNSTIKIKERERIQSQNGILDIMAAVDEDAHKAVTKTYFYGNGSDFGVILFDTIDSEILLIVRGKKLTQIRTAAVTALATRYLSNKDSSILGVIGSGYQSIEQIKAITKVRDINKIMIFSRNVEHSKSLKKRIINDLKINSVEVLNSANENFLKADIILTVTNSSNPVIQDKYIKKDAYLNCIGSYTVNMSELEEITICNSKLIVVDSLKQAIRESGELAKTIGKCILLDEVNELSDILNNNIKKRKVESNRIIFKSVGMAAEDLVAMEILYNKVMINK